MSFAEVLERTERFNCLQISFNNLSGDLLSFCTRSLFGNDDFPTLFQHWSSQAIEELKWAWVDLRKNMLGLDRFAIMWCLAHFPHVLNNLVCPQSSIHFDVEADSRPVITTSSRTRRDDSVLGDNGRLSRLGNTLFGCLLCAFDADISGDGSAPRNRRFIAVVIQPDLNLKARVQSADDT